MPFSTPSTDPRYSGGDPKGLEIGGGNGLAIRAACFNEKGDLLFVWASGDIHHGYLYKMNGYDAALIGEVLYERVPFSFLLSIDTIAEILKAPNDSKDFALWPFESIPACIVHNSQGSTFVMQPSSHPPQQLQTRQSLGIPSALVACVVHNDLLICIQKRSVKGRKRRIFEYELSKETDKQFLITKSSSGLASVERSVTKTAKAAIQLGEGQLLLTLFTTKGEILNFIRKS